jgi:hypothetical protein
MAWSSYDAIDQLLDKERWMVPLTLREDGFQESGIHTSSKVCMHVLKTK